MSIEEERLEKLACESLKLKGYIDWSWYRVLALFSKKNK